MANSQGASPWTYVGIGCLAVVLVVVVGAGVAGFLGYQWVQETREAIVDPETREAKALELLGADSLPEGYYPGFALSLPFLVDVAVLSDQVTRRDRGPHFKERGFIFASIRDFGDKRRQLRDFVEGRSDRNEVLDNVKIDIDMDLDRQDPITSGSFSVPRGQASFVAYRASWDSDDDGFERRKGIATLISIECETDSRLKLGIWFGPNPTSAEDAAVQAVSESTESLAEEAREDYSGSGADPAAVEAFLANFRICSQ